MNNKYGFGGGIELPKANAAPKVLPKADHSRLAEAVQAGDSLGFVDREPSGRRRPGPKRTEPQAKISIPGPKRVIDEFRGFCQEHDVTLWRGLELLLSDKNSGNS